MKASLILQAARRAAAGLAWNTEPFHAASRLCREASRNLGNRRGPMHSTTTVCRQLENRKTS